MWGAAQDISLPVQPIRADVHGRSASLLPRQRRPKEAWQVFLQIEPARLAYSDFYLRAVTCIGRLTRDANFEQGKNRARTRFT